MKPIAYPSRPATPWKVEIPPSMSGGPRARKFFATKEKALEFISTTKKNAAALGHRAFAPSGPPAGGLTVAALADLFYATKAREFGGDYLASLRTHLKRIKAQWGERPAQSLKPPELVDWLADLPLAPTSRFNVFKILRTLFTWADLMDYVPQSVVRKVPPPRKGEPGKAILSVGEMKTALTKADAVVFPYVCLGGFAGLRTAEILKLRWEDIDWEAAEIHVRPGVMKRTRGAIRERYVAILPALDAWLRPRAAPSGAVVALSEAPFPEAAHPDGFGQRSGWLPIAH